ncbi:hypothetical protein HUZ36_10545 [Pseudoalteromonas sp. McH1-7]|uniref:hypothetical protein n=1 Tax=unclassified Pseudoalteromonas TaxID=194690 RepID=UPI001476C7DB|nr:MULTISPECIES: hypothetical protein [unclassified Pseudoalteromonas]NUZ11220.1 hypothetical protein [Pseudoalteromonas sp. McH1-7]
MSNWGGKPAVSLGCSKKAQEKLQIGMLTIVLANGAILKHGKTQIVWTDILPRLRTVRLSKQIEA